VDKAAFVVSFILPKFRLLYQYSGKINEKISVSSEVMEASFGE